MGEFLREHYGSLVRMLHRRTGDRRRAEDLAQQTLEQATADFLSLDDDPRPWLFATALNLVREDTRRSLREGRRLVLVRNDPAPSEEHSETSPPPPEEAAARTALASVGDRDRDAMLLKAEGLSYEEIAATLGMSKDAVGEALARARRRLVEGYRERERGHHAAS